MTALRVNRGQGGQLRGLRWQERRTRREERTTFRSFEPFVLDGRLTVQVYAQRLVDTFCSLAFARIYKSQMPGSGAFDRDTLGDEANEKMTTVTRTGARATTRLREVLAQPGMVLAPFVFDALQAKVAEAAGFEVVYMTGFGTAAARGYADVGLLTLTEMVDNARAIARSVSLPVVSDADTGYGNPVNVVRTVHEFEDAGIGAIHIEDQVWPKRCGFLEGKEVIPLAEAAAKISAAVGERRDPDFVVIARTDALQPNGWDDVERRARAYREAGADLLFVDGIRTPDDLDTYVERLGDLPLVYNGQLLPAKELEAHGFALTIHTGVLGALYRAVKNAMRELRETGSVAAGQDTKVFAEMVALLGVSEAFALGRKYGA